MRVLRAFLIAPAVPVIGMALYGTMYDLIIVEGRAHSVIEFSAMIATLIYVGAFFPI